MGARLFLSYARDDDEPFAKRLHADLTARGFDMWWDRVSMPSRGLTFTHEIRDAILASERLILVWGPSAATSDYVRHEWGWALAMGVVVNPVLRIGRYEDLDADLPRSDIPDFRGAAEGPATYDRFAGQLAARVAPLGDNATVPALPKYYLERRDGIAALRDAVLADLFGPVAITAPLARFGLRGMAGIGKTTAARALAHRHDVRRAFPDGVAWIEVGQKANPLDLQARAARILFGDDRASGAWKTVEDGRTWLARALRDKSALLVLDNVWNADHVRPAFDCLGAKSRMVLTTRNASILTALDAKEHRLGLLSEPEALDLLALWKECERAALPPEAPDLVHECGYLPLAIKLSGARMRDGVPCADLLAALRERDLRFLDHEHESALTMIQLSVDALPAADAARLRELVVFAEGAAIPEGATVALWARGGAMADRDARDLLTRLERQALVETEGASPGRHAAVHDLVRDCLSMNGPDSRILHEGLVSGYRARCAGGWDNGPDDGYFLRHLAAHLAGAGRWEELSGLLADYRWIERKVRDAGLQSLLADYGAARSPEAATALSEDHLRALRYVEEAVQLSQHILARDPGQLPSQLLGRLLGAEDPAIRTLLDEATRNAQGPWLRPTAPSLTPPGTGLLRTLEGHAGRVWAVALDSGGGRIVSASSDETLKVWDLGTGECLRTLEGHAYWVTAVALDSGGGRAVSGSYDRTLKVWDLGTGECLRTLEGHAGGVNAVALDPEGGRAVSGSADGTLKVWDLGTGTCLRTLEGHTHCVTAVALDPEGGRAVSASGDQTLKVWDLGTGECLRTLEGHADWVTAVALDSGGGRAVSASGDRTLKVWDLRAGTCLRTLEGHTHCVTAVALDPEGGRAVSASGDQTLKVWDLGTGECLRTLEGHAYRVTAVALDSGGGRAVSGSYDRTLKVWDLATGECLRTLEGHAGPVTAVALDPEGGRAVSGSWDDTLKVWDLRAGECLRTLEGHAGGVNAVALDPEGGRAVSASGDQTLKVWDLGTGECLRTLEGHADRVTAVALDPGGGRAVSGSWDDTLKVWDLATGACLRTLEGHADWVNAVALDPEGGRAVSGSADGTLKVWDLGTGTCLRTLEGHTHCVTAVALDPEGGRAVSASGDQTLKVWDLATGTCLRTLEGHTDSVTAVALDSGGGRAVSASGDRTLKVWDLRAGECLATFEADAPILCVAWAKGGGRIVAGDAGGRVHFLVPEGFGTTRSGTPGTTRRTPSSKTGERP